MTPLFIPPKGGETAPPPSLPLDPGGEPVADPAPRDGDADGNDRPSSFLALLLPSRPSSPARGVPGAAAAASTPLLFSSPILGFLFASPPIEFPVFGGLLATRPWLGDSTRGTEQEEEEEEGEGAAGTEEGCQRSWIDRSSSRHSDGLARQKLRRLGVLLLSPPPLAPPLTLEDLFAREAETGMPRTDGTDA